MILLNLKYRLVKFIEQLPFLQIFIYNNLSKFKFLFPHDKDYLALKLIFKPDEKRDFIDVGFNADIPNNVIQTVGYMSDYEKLTQAKELLVDVGKYNKGRYKRISEPYNQGFKQNPTQYIVIFWERV